MMDQVTTLVMQAVVAVVQEQQALTKTAALDYSHQLQELQRTMQVAVQLV
jgi:hypothetical protein